MGNGASSRKVELWVNLALKSLMISFAVWIKYTSVADIQTERQTDTGRWLVLRLSIASRGKNQTRIAFDRGPSAHDCDSAYFMVI